MPNYTYPYPGLPGGAPPQAVLAVLIPSLIVSLLFLVFFVWIYGRILHKAGYSGWLALLMLIPLVNIILILWFAFATWPVERRAAAMGAPQAPAGYYPPQQPQVPVQPAYAPPAPQPPGQPLQPPAQPPQPPAQPPQQPGGYPPPPQA